MREHNNCETCTCVPSTPYRYALNDDEWSPLMPVGPVKEILDTRPKGTVLVVKDGNHSHHYKKVG